MTEQQYPRSPKAFLGGIAHLRRFIDKIQLRHAGKIQDYNYITVGFDKYLIEFLQIDPKAFEQRVLAGGTDEDMLGGVRAHGKPVTQRRLLNGATIFWLPVRKMKQPATGFKAARKRSLEARCIYSFTASCDYLGRCH